MGGDGGWMGRGRVHGKVEKKILKAIIAYLVGNVSIRDSKQQN